MDKSLEIEMTMWHDNSDLAKRLQAGVYYPVVSIKALFLLEDMEK